MASPKKITITETDLTPEQAADVAAYVAAHRAAEQAKEIMNATGGKVLALAKANPGLLVAGVRITVGKRSTWKYGSDIVGLKAQLADLEKEARGAGLAKESTTQHIILKELSKFAGQAIAMPSTLWGKVSTLLNP